MSTVDIQSSITQLRAGKAVIVTDHKTRENEADLICAAEYITTELMAFFIRYSSGIVCVPLLQERADRFALPRLTSATPAKYDTPFTMPVDYLPSCNGGVSAAERTATVQALVNPETAPTDFGRPGHVFPLIADPGGLAARVGHTEAAIHLMQLADLQPIAVIVELMTDTGSMLRGTQLTTFAAAHQLNVISIAALEHTL